jgi:hypothetical protein
MLIGLFFLRARERGVKEREGQIAQIAFGSKQLKSYFIRLNFNPQNSSRLFLQRHPLYLV